jgi:hypothetical protein
LSCHSLLLSQDSLGIHQLLRCLTFAKFLPRLREEEEEEEEEEEDSDRADMGSGGCSASM